MLNEGYFANFAQHWLPWQRPLRNKKNWPGLTTFTQIPSIWWKKIVKIGPVDPEIALLKLKQVALLSQRDCATCLLAYKSLQSMNDHKIHSRSSQLLLLNGHTAYHFLFVDCCFNVIIYRTVLRHYSWSERNCLWPWEILHFSQRSLYYKPRALSNLCVNRS